MNDTFYYEPNGFENWTRTIVNYLCGGGKSDSVSGISESFKAQMRKLVEKGVWTGTAAKQNYDNFKQTLNSLIQFINSFGTVYAQSMTEFNKKLQQLEQSNLGNGSISAANPSYSDMDNLAEELGNQTDITYNYEVITSIGNELNNILNNLETLKGKIDSELDKVGSGSNIWAGNLASRTKEELKNELSKGYNTIKENLNVCITNIKTAAQNAASFNS